MTRPRLSVARAGVLQYMVSDGTRLGRRAPHTHRPQTTHPAPPAALQVNDVDLVERVGTHVVAKIKGDLQETFDRLDEDGDGQISASELAALLAEVNQGQAVDEQSVQRVMSEVAKRRDAEGNGIILFDDFRKWYMQSEQRMRADLDEMWCKIVGAIHLDADMEATRLVATLSASTS